MRVIASQAADELLNISGVDASFLLFKVGSGVNMSARSMGAINVQVIMESLGGGGHLTMAAAQLPEITMEETRHMAALAAGVTHDHPEGIKGAESTAAAIFLARTGHSKAEIKEYVEWEFGYDLSRTLDEIRPRYRFNESCQDTVPQAITAFLESKNFEDAIRNAISLGGDSDTLAAITGSIAEAAYGVPQWIKDKAWEYLDEPLREVLRKWQGELSKRGASL